MMLKLTVFLLFYSLRVQKIIKASAPSPWPPFNIPEIDGFPVYACMNQVPSTPKPATTTWATTTALTATLTLAATRPISKKQEAPTTMNSKTRNTGTPIRPQPLPAGPISNALSNQDTIRLLHLLLASTRKRILNSQPIGVQPRKRSNNAKLATKLGSLSSESSDES